MESLLQGFDLIHVTQAEFLEIPFIFSACNEGEEAQELKCKFIIIGKLSTSLKSGLHHHGNNCLILPFSVLLN